jgi:pimeloyl-ACP methyl ester carboxylesterase
VTTKKGTIMSDLFSPKRFDVPVNGGDLRVAQWGEDGPVILGLHGITASHMTWPYVARELSTDTRFVAPDLRGRGGSRELPGPYGMKVHADDCIAVLDNLGVESAVVVGHSMGGFVAAIMALHYPERISHLVLIDGGVPLFIPPPDMDLEQVLQAMLGPAIQRLDMTFESLEQYYDFWRPHPSVQDEGAWNELFEAYLAYDMMGEPPALRSKANKEAVLGDGRDSLVDEDLRVAVEKFSGPITFIRAPRGILNETPGLYSNDLAKDLVEKHPNITDVLIEDVNHYTVTTSERGAVQTATVIRKALQGVSA